jgi:hypothetical protein
MQRLASSLASGERTATKTLSELRTISPKLENVLQLRGEVRGKMVDGGGREGARQASVEASSFSLMTPLPLKPASSHLP